MKFMCLEAASIYTYKIQRKLGIGGSRVQEIGGCKSGVASVKYRCKSKCQKNCFLIFWATSSYTCTTEGKVEVGRSDVKSSS